MAAGSRVKTSIARRVSPFAPRVIELERGPIVTDNRSAFQSAMGDRFIAAVEQVTRRRVVHFISSHHVGPDLEIELSFLDGEAQV